MILNFKVTKKTY
jgi:hypothetical protein